MKQYWNEMMTPMPSFRIKELVQRHDNIYVEDEYGRVWQIWFEVEGPMYRMVDRA